MAKLFRYRATRKGTLSRPFRFIEEGQEFSSPVEMKGSWFVPADQPIAPKSDVLVPYMKIDGRVQRPDFGPVTPQLAQEQKTKGVPPVPKDPQYEAGMKGVLKVEAALAKSLKPQPEKEEVKEDGGDAGTGNQDVLG